MADHGDTTDTPMTDGNMLDPCRVLEAKLCAALNEFKATAGSDIELNEIGADLLVRCSRVLLRDSLPQGTRLTGLCPLRVNAGKSPNAYATYQGNDEGDPMTDDDDTTASMLPDDDEVETSDEDPDDVDEGEPEPPVHQPVTRQLNFDFSMVLPEAVLFQRYNEPYDRSWFETLSADPAKLDEWNRMTSRWKLVDLVSKGAVVEGDEFEIAVVAANGEKMDRYVKIVGFESGEEANCPKIRLSQMLCRDPPSKEIIVKGPVDMTEKTIRHYRAKKAQFVPRREGWRRVSVWRDELEIDSLFDMRQKYALWDETVRWFTTENNLNGRKRTINRKTGQPFQFPALNFKQRDLM